MDNQKQGFHITKIISSHILIPERLFPVVGTVFELLGDLLPSFGAHLMVFARKP